MRFLVSEVPLQSGESAPAVGAEAEVADEERDVVVGLRWLLNPTSGGLPDQVRTTYSLKSQLRRDKLTFDEKSVVHCAVWSINQLPR